MKTPCIGCGKLIMAGSMTRGRCFACQSPARHYRASRDWVRKREAARATGVCARCGRAGVPLQVHHVQPLGRDMGGVDGPLEALCASCHHLRHR